METIFGTSSMNRRRFLTRSAHFIGAVMGASALLEACGQEAASSNGTTTLTIMSSSTELSKAQISEFEKLNPGIKINLLENDPVRLNAMFAAGQPPDSFRAIGATDTPSLVSRGLVADLTTYFNKSTLLNPSGLASINDVYRWDGKVQGQGPRYGVAKDWSLDLQLWYNKKLFDQAGVAYPSTTEPMTYDQLLALAKKLTVRKGDTTQIYGLDIGWTMGNAYGLILQNLLQENKTLFNSDYSQADFTTPEAKKLLQWFVDWARAGVGPSPLESNPSNGWVLYPAGRVAMWFCGYYMGGALAGSAPEVLTNSALAPTPQWGSTRVAGCISATGACIANTSPNKEAAWKFMEYYMGGQPAHDRAATGWGIPSVKNYFSLMPQQTPVQQELYQSVLNDMKYQQVLPFAPYISSAAMTTALTKYMGPVMKGQVSLDQGAQQLTDAVNLLLGQGKSLAG